MSHLCDVCGEEFYTTQSFEEHKKKQHILEYFQCKKCNKNLKSKKSLLRHVKDQHEVKRFNCSQCKYKTSRPYLFSAHKKTHISKPQVSNPSSKKVKRNEMQNSKTLSQPAKEDVQRDDSTQHDEVFKTAFRGKMQERSSFSVYSPRV